MSWPAWSLSAIAGGALLAWYASTARGNLPKPTWWAIVGLMAAALCVPLVVLLNPVWVTAVPPPPGKPLVTLLVDSSAGMATRDADGLTRFDAARTLALATVKQLEQDYDVETRLFAEESRMVAPDALASATAVGESTDLATAIEQSLVDDRPRGQAIILLSDGIHNADPAAARVIEASRRAKASATPVFVHTFGGAATVRDIDVRFPSAEELAFIGQRLPVELRVTARGLAGQSVDVVLRRGTETIEQQRITLADGPNRVRFRVREDTVGLERYEAVVSPLEGEVSDLNNSAPLVVRTVDRPIRVLLLEGKPYWDTKFLTRTLTTDAAVELTTVVQLAPERLLVRTLSPQPADTAADDEVKPVVSHQEDWEIVADPKQWLSDDKTLDSFQVVVLGREADIFLTGSASSRLRRWIDRQGGSLVCFRGAPAVTMSRDLAAVLPLRWIPAMETRFHVQMTEYGRNWRWFPDDQDGQSTFDALPSLATTATPDRLKPAARVLATTAAASEADGRAVVTYQPYGLGQIVVVEGAGMWRWAFLPPRQQDRDSVYSDLWRSVIRRLVSGAGLLPGQAMAVRSEKSLFSDREPAAVAVLVRDVSAIPSLPEIELSGGPLETPRRIRPTAVEGDPTLFRGRLGLLPEGRYRARLVGEGLDAERDDLETAFDVRRNLAEQLDLEARPDLMARIADESDGGVLTDGSASEVALKLQAHEERTRPREVRRVEAWDRWWILAAAFGLWAATWSLRRRSGRV
jgi:hypothetical protein